MLRTYIPMLRIMAMQAARKGLARVLSTARFVKSSSPLRSCLGLCGGRPTQTEFLCRAVRVFHSSFETRCRPTGSTQSDHEIKRTHLCGELRGSDEGNPVRLCGWLASKRIFNEKHGFGFGIIRDWSGNTQVIIRSECKNSASIMETLSEIPLESVISVKGTARKRPENEINRNMSTGEIEVVLEDVVVLNRCRNAPFQIQDERLKKVDEATRLRYRYLELRSKILQRNLRLRSDVVMKMREFLTGEGFVDVETPTLFKRTPGGADEFIVPTKETGKFYTLPQSPQQFKQLLMVGGVDRYFQIARCYRDESSRSDRQPEFTQLDLEMSFVTMADVKSVIENLIKYFWPDDLQKVRPPFPSLSYSEAIARYGSDKPDTRFEFHLNNITKFCASCGFSIFEDAASNSDETVQCINFKNASQFLKKSERTKLEAVAKQYDLQGISIVKIGEDNAWKSPAAKYLTDTFKERLKKELDISTGDIIIIVCGPYTKTCEALGKIRLQFAGMIEANGVALRDHAAFNFLWVESFPLFAKNEDGGWESVHHPFTAPATGQQQLLSHDPSQITGQHYDLVLNGNEIGGGSIRVHDAGTQRYILEQILKEDASSLEHLLEALDSGAPPHGGIALGLDRLIAVMSGSTSIKEVIAFPKTNSAQDLMSGAPCGLDAEYLQRYHILNRKC